MNGAEALLRAAAAAGVDVCFANPGTTEMDLVVALDAVPSIRPVLGLFEGVCTGAADGYGRMADRPALTLLHLGPGLANGIANLHNARRARTPVVNVVGDHASWHRAADPPLSSDIEGLARTVSRWVRTSRSAAAVEGDVADAIGAATAPPGGVATLIVPQDRAWLDVEPAETRGTTASAPTAGDRTSPDADAVRRAAQALRPAGERGLLWLGGRALRERGLDSAARITLATGCQVRHDPFPARLERGAGRPAFEPLPYFPEQAVDDLSGVSTVVLAGAPAPVAFFGYRDGVSELLPTGCEVIRLDAERGWADDALAALAAELDAPPMGASARAEAPAPPTGELTVGSLGRAVATVQPEGAIVVNEAATASRAWHGQSVGAPPHTELSLTGGAIGQGLPCAVGAAMACRDRQVIALEADGSGLYTLQSLWTMAREALEVTVVVCANRRYRILQHELGRIGVEQAGPAAAALTELDHPHIDWVSLARGFGVPAVAVESAEDLVRELARALAEPGPALIEAML